MENIIYNELVKRQFSVDVGVVYARTINQNGNSVRTPREIDFVVTSGGKKTYIQSAYSMPTEEKVQMELRPFALTGDSFPKIVVRKDIGKRWYDENGILNINLIDFLLDAELISAALYSAHRMFMGSGTENPPHCGKCADRQ